jgi:hypothetical protein
VQDLINANASTTGVVRQWMVDDRVVCPTCGSHDLEVTPVLQQNAPSVLAVHLDRRTLSVAAKDDRSIASSLNCMLQGVTYDLVAVSEHIGLFDAQAHNVAILVH